MGDANVGGYDPMDMMLTVGTFGAYAVAKEAGAFGDPRESIFGGNKQDDDDSPARQQQAGVTDTTAIAPSAQKVNPNDAIMAKQQDRRKQLLFQSTGREQAQGPTIENKTNKNKLF